MRLEHKIATIHNKHSLKPRAIMLVLLIILLGVNISQAATYYLNSAVNTARNAQLPANWWTSEGGTVTQAANFTTSGDIFIVPAGVNGVIANGSAVSIGSGVTLQVLGTMALGTGGGPVTVSLTIAGSVLFSDASALQLLDGNSNASSTLSFNLSSGANLVCANAGGITGSIQTTQANSPITLNLNTGANYEFNGSDQTTNGITATVNNLIFSGSGTKTLTTTLSTISGSLAIDGTASTTAVAGLTINGSMSIASGASFNAGSFSHTLKGNLSNSGSFTGATSTLTVDGSSQQTLGGSGTTTFNSLTINNTLGAKASGDLTVNGILNLQSANPNETDGTLDMVISYGDYSNVLTAEADLTTTYTQTHDILNSYILFMGPNSRNSGSGDVTGKVKRTTIANNTAYTFGNQYTTITFNDNATGTLPTEMMFVITKGSERGIHSNKTSTVQRLYQVIRSGGTTPTTFSIRLSFLESELNGNPEDELIIWDHHIPYSSSNTPHEHGKAAQNLSQNWVELSGHGITYLPTNMSQAVGGTIRSKYWMIHKKLTNYNTWLAAYSSNNTNWNEPSNWGGGVPTSASDIKIPGTGVSAYPIPTGNIVAKSIFIESGASFNLPAGIKLTIYGGIDTTGGNGSILNNGTFTAGAGSKVVFDFASNLGKGQTATISGDLQVADIDVIGGTKLVVQDEANLKISGTVSVTGSSGGIASSADFSSNHQTVEYNGTSAQSIYALSGSGTYHNLHISNSNVTTLPTTLNVKGNLSWSGSGSLNINSGTLVMNGADAQTISGNDFGFNNLTLNNASGLTLGSSQSLSGSLTLSSGKITTGAYALQLGSDASITGAGSSNYIYGLLERSYATGTSSKTYPIGDATYYTPLTLSIADVTTAGSLTASTTASDHPNLSSSKFVPASSINRYFTLTNEGIAFTTADLSLSWDASDADASLTASRLKVGKYNGSSWDYPTVSGPASTSIVAEDFTSFSDFQVGEVYTYWTGASSTDWSTAGNWDPAEVPGSSISVIIPDVSNDPIVSNSISSPALARDVTLNSGAVLTVNPLSALTIDRSLTNNAGTSGLVLQSDATGTGSLIQPSADVNASVKRYIEAASWLSGTDGWHFLSSAVKNQAIESAFTTSGSSNDYDFYAWNPTDYLWVNYKNTDGTSGFAAFNGSNLFEEGRGYMVAYQQTATKTFSGALNNENISFTNLSPSGEYAYHLLGNPFSSALLWDAEADWAKTGIGGVAKIWNESNSAYTDISSGSVIPSTNGFMVLVSEASNGITIPVSKKTHNTQNFYKTQSGVRLLLSARDLASGYAQDLVIRTHFEASETFDLEHDARFLWGYAPGFYANAAGGEFLSTNTLPLIDESTVIPLTFIPNGGTLHQIEFSGVETLGMNVWLYDKQLDLKYLLNENVQPYSFSSVAADASDRFELIFTDYTDIEAIDTNQDRVWYNSSNIFVQSSTSDLSVEVIDIQGRVLLRHLLDGAGLHVLPFVSKPAVYFVRLTQPDAISNHKIITQ